MQKKVFRYWNGAKEVWGDPVEIWERLSEALGANPQIAYSAQFEGKADPKEKYPSEELWQAAQAEEHKALPRRIFATREMRKAVRFAFNMVPFKEEAEKLEDIGATAEECDRAIDAYIAFATDQKKSGEPAPT